MQGPAQRRNFLSPEQRANCLSARTVGGNSGLPGRERNPPRLWQDVELFRVRKAEFFRLSRITVTKNSATQKKLTVRKRGKQGIFLLPQRAQVRPSMPDRNDRANVGSREVSFFPPFSHFHLFPFFPFPPPVFVRVPPTRNNSKNPPSLPRKSTTSCPRRRGFRPLRGGPKFGSTVRGPKILRAKIKGEDGLCPAVSRFFRR